MIVFGSEFPRSRIHRFRSDFPPRFVVQNTDVVWNACDVCGREHRIWMTGDATWARLPTKKLRRARICVGCFRGSVLSTSSTR